MRKAVVLTIIGILLLGAGGAIGWYVARRAALDAEQRAAANGARIVPALEQVDEAEEALRLAGFEQAFVYRWRGGLLDGFLLLDTPQGTERESLDTAQVSRDAHANLMEAYAEKARARPDAPKGQPDGTAPHDAGPLDLARVRGLIVIAIRPKEKDAAGLECIMRLSVTEDGADKSSGGASTGILSGRLPDYAGIVSGQGLCKLSLAGGGYRDLFELHLRQDTPPAK